MRLCVPQGPGPQALGPSRIPAAAELSLTLTVEQSPGAPAALLTPGLATLVSTPTPASMLASTLASLAGAQVRPMVRTADSSG